MHKSFKYYRWFVLYHYHRIIANIYYKLAIKDRNLGRHYGFWATVLNKRYIKRHTAFINLLKAKKEF